MEMPFSRKPKYFFFLNLEEKQGFKSGQEYCELDWRRHSADGLILCSTSSINCCCLIGIETSVPDSIADVG